MPYALRIADVGVQAAMRADRALLRGLNTFGGSVTCEPVARAHGMTHVPPEQAIG
jgi:alanine dehydrogenase